MIDKTARPVGDFVFSVFDKKALVYGPLFIFKHTGEAIRFVEDILSNKESTLSRHPDDYALYQLAVFDEKSGSVVPCSPIQFIGEVRSFIPVVKPVEVPRG